MYATNNVSKTCNILGVCGGGFKKKSQKKTHLKKLYLRLLKQPREHAASPTDQTAMKTSGTLCSH